MYTELSYTYLGLPLDGATLPALNTALKGLCAILEVAVYAAAFVPFQAFRNWKRSLENPDARGVVPVGVFMIPVGIMLYLCRYLNLPD
jgi:hypothetical protein